MSVATQIQNYNDGLLSSYQAVIDKGGTVPANKNLINLPTAINSISGGGGYDEYFTSPILADGTTESWKRNCKKFSAMEMSGTNCVNMFYNCPMKEIDTSLFDTSRVANMQYMFRACRNLQSLDLLSFDTSNVTNMRSMFDTCSELETLNLSSFNFESITSNAVGESLYTWLNGCSNLKNLTFGINLGKGFTATAHYQYAKLDLSACTLLTHDSLMSVINNLYDISDKNTQDLALGAANLAKLSSSEIAIATNKGWTVS